MSKSGTDHNVEDMLSSVRRLVSDELPRMPRADVPKGPAALVLTEQQRIEPPQMGHNSRRKSLEVRIAELEAAVAESADEYEPDGSEDLDQHRPDRIVFKPSRAVTRPPVSPPLRLTELSLVTPEVDSSTQVTALHEGGADFSVEPVVDAGTDTETASGAGDATEFETETETETESEADIQADVEVALTEAVTSAIAEMAEEAFAGDAAFEAALSEAVSAVPVAPSPDPEDAFGALNRDDFEDDASETPEVDDAWDDLPEDVVDVAPVDAETTESTGVEVSEIRPLIAAMIRDELQGDLGERITRNVRKLVRQEIQRALTVREIE